MTIDPEPTPELRTTRTGGRSARLIALAVVLVLASVVYIGASQRDSGLLPATGRPAAAVASNQPTPGGAATPTHAATVPPPSTPPRVAVLNESSGLVGPYGDLRVMLSVGESFAIAALDEVRARQLHAAFRVEQPEPMSFATLELMEGRQDGGPIYASWAVPLDIPVASENVDVDIGAAAPTTLFEQDQPPDPTAVEDAPILNRNGYRMRVTGARIGDAATLNVDIQLARDPTYPDEGYNVVATAGAREFRTNQSTVQIEPGHISGEIFMPLDLRAKNLTVVLSALPAGWDAPVVVAVDRFHVPSASEHQISQSSSSSRGAPDPSLPRILTNGFSYSLVFTFDGESRALFWDVKINPNFEIDP